MKKLLVIGVLLAPLVACGTQSTPDAASSSESEDAARIVADESDLPVRQLWMPPFTAHARASREGAKACRVAVDVELSMASETLTGVLLTDHVIGDCAIRVDPNKRFYVLESVGKECGSRIYEGRLEGDRATTVRVLDHNDRACSDRRLGMIEVEETSAGLRKRTVGGEWPSDARSVTRDY